MTHTGMQELSDVAPAGHPSAVAAARPSGVRTRKLWRAALIVVGTLHALALLCLQALQVRAFGYVGEDFAMLWDSSRAFREGGHFYFLTNLNHPFTVVAMSPLTLLSPRHAYLLWIT